MNVSECIDVCVLSILGVYICVCGPYIRCEYYVCIPTCVFCIHLCMLGTEFWFLSGVLYNVLSPMLV